jgi:hypothetical protein
MRQSKIRKYPSPPRSLRSPITTTQLPRFPQKSTRRGDPWDDRWDPWAQVNPLKEVLDGCPSVIDTPPMLGIFNDVPGSKVRIIYNLNVDLAIRLLYPSVPRHVPAP